MSAITQDIHVLRKSIIDEHKKAIGAGRKTLEHIRTCGTLLIEFKERVEHGKFRNYLLSMGISPTTATNYMRVASKWATVAHLHKMRDAIRLLSRADVPLEMQEIPSGPPPEIKLKSAPTPPASGEVIEAEVSPSKPEPMDTAQARRDAVDAELISDDPSPPASPEPSRATAKASSDDPYLTIMRLLPKITKQQAHEIMNALQTRWIR